jgi:hypothetical protein
MSQLLTVDIPVQAEMRSTTLLLGGSQFPQFSRRLSELLAESGQHVVEGAIPASVNLRKGLTAASLRVIWILDACSACIAVCTACGRSISPAESALGDRIAGVAGGDSGSRDSGYSAAWLRCADGG